MSLTSLQDLHFYTALLTINTSIVMYMYVGSYVMEDIQITCRVKQAHLLVTYMYNIIRSKLYTKPPLPLLMPYMYM